MHQTQKSPVLIKPCSRRLLPSKLQAALAAAPLSGAAAAYSASPARGSCRAASVPPASRRPCGPRRWRLRFLPRAGKPAAAAAAAATAGCLARSNSSPPVTRDKLLTGARSLSLRPAWETQGAAGASLGRGWRPGRLLLPAGSRPHLGCGRLTKPAGAAQAELAGGRGHERSRPLAGRGGSGPAVTWAPSSRPAGHRQSVAEQEPRAQPARARLSAYRRLRWLGLQKERLPAARRWSRPRPRRRGRLGPDQGQRLGGRSTGSQRGFGLRGRALRSLSRRRQTSSGGQREGRRTQDTVPTPESRGTSDLCNCCHFGVWCFAAVASILAACSLSSRPPWLPESTGRRRPEAAGRALSTMRTLGTCVVTLTGLLLTAAGETFSGKRGATTVPGAPET